MVGRTIGCITAHYLNKKWGYDEESIKLYEIEAYFHLVIEQLTQFEQDLGKLKLGFDQENCIQTVRF